MREDSLRGRGFGMGERIKEERERWREIRWKSFRFWYGLGNLNFINKFLWLVWS